MKDFNQYLKAVIERNREAHEAGYLITFDYPVSLILHHKKYFQDCFEQNLSPYKALTFFYDNLAE